MKVLLQLEEQHKSSQFENDVVELFNEIRQTVCVRFQHFRLSFILYTLQYTLQFVNRHSWGNGAMRGA
jgi:hypothetical protein